MIIYNVTVKIDNSVHQEWVQWMTTLHIPDVMKTGLFKEYRFCKVLGDDDTDGVTYATQYICEDLSLFHKYQQYHAPALQEAHSKRYSGKYVAFRTLLQVVDWKMYAPQELN